MIGKEGKKGQVTIFIIIAILIVALGVLIYLYYPEIKSSLNQETKNPSGYIKNCIEEEIEDNTQTILLQGGDFVVDKNNGYFYKKEDNEEGRYVKYLCYTGDSFKACINQEPFLTEHIESEILNSIIYDAEGCFDSLVKSYETRGYDVDLKNGTVSVKIIPSAISTNFNRTLTLTKGDETEKYESFKVDLNSNVHEMLEVSKNIILWEINVGDSLPEAYMYNNPYLRVEKHRKDNEVKIYLITDLNTEEDFRFAVRSFAAPVGFV